MSPGTIASVLILLFVLQCDSLFRTSLLTKTGGLAMSQLTNTELLTTIQRALENHKAGNIAEAINFYEKALPQLSGNTKASMSGNVGSLHMSQGNYERAAQHFMAAVEADGSNPSAHYNLAVILTTQLGQHAKAIKHCGKALQLDPDNYKAHHLMGNIMQSIGRPAEAEKYFVAAENLALQSKGAVQALEAGQGSSALERLSIMGTKLHDVIAVTVEGADYSLECVSVTPLIFVVDNLISDEDCEHIMEKASGLLEKSYVMGGGGDGYGKTGQCSVSDSACEQSAGVDPALYRSSYTAWLPQDTVLDALQSRLSGILGISSAYLKQKSEQLQVVRYSPGGQFKPHQDSSAFNSRLVTALLYLNTPAAGEYCGGETWFPYARSEPSTSDGNHPDTVESSVRNALGVFEGAMAEGTPLPGLKVSPRRGRAVIFFNHLRSGAIDPRAVHAGLPVEAPAALPAIEKWVANYWIELDETALADHVA
jgi:thioredoxin-like negative regulator of GroEL